MRQTFQGLDDKLLEGSDWLLAYMKSGHISDNSETTYRFCTIY